MDISKVYQKFLDRINGLSTDHGQQVGGLRQFVDTFYEAELSLMSEVLKADEATDNLQEYLAPYVRTVGLDGPKRRKYYEFKLPEDFEHQKDLWCTGTRPGCTAPLEMQLRRTGEASRLYYDPENEPSLEWEGSYFTLSDGSIRAYYKGFEITEATLDYYSRPTRVNIAGYSIDGVPSVDIDPQIEGRYLEMVLDRAARIHLRNTGSPKINLFSQ